MNKSEKYAEELIQFIEALHEGQNVSRPSTLDPMGADLTTDLVDLARTIQPAASFTEELKERLLRVNETERRIDDQSFSHSIQGLVTAWRSVMLKRKRVAYAIGLLALLVFSAFVAVPALARFALEHFAPREVEKPPIAGESVTLATIPPEAYSDNIEELEKQAGFSALMPHYVPSNCRLSESYYLPEPIGEIHLIYYSISNLPCFEVAQRETRGNTIQRPFVGDGSLEEITIKGKPAIYIKGIWWIDIEEDHLSGNGNIKHLAPKELEKLFESATWMDNGFQQLIFEHNGLLILLDAGANISKEELVKIAESME